MGLARSGLILARRGSTVASDNLTGVQVASPIANGFKPVEMSK